MTTQRFLILAGGVINVLVGLSHTGGRQCHTSARFAKHGGGWYFFMLSTKSSWACELQSCLGIALMAAALCSSVRVFASLVKALPCLS
jgi:hypothetical protein